MAKLAELFWAFLKLGLFTIGGGYAMIPQMQQIAVDEHHWMTEEEVVDCIAVSQSLPGVIAINMATYIGRKLYGFRGAVCATIGVVIPSFVIISLIVLLLGAIGDNPWVGGAFLGAKAAVCGLILVSVIRLGKQTLRKPFHWVLMIGALLAVGVFGITAYWVILAGILAGILWSIRMQGKTEAGDAAAYRETAVEADRENEVAAEDDAALADRTTPEAGNAAGTDSAAGTADRETAVEADREDEAAAVDDAALADRTTPGAGDAAGIDSGAGAADRETAVEADREDEAAAVDDAAVADRTTPEAGNAAGTDSGADTAGIDSGAGAAGIDSGAGAAGIDSAEDAADPDGEEGQR